MNIADNIHKLQNSQHIEFSAISGYNYYYLAEDQQIGGPIHALHAPSDTLVYLVSLGMRDSKLGDREVEWYRGFLHKPMTSRYFEWPIDLLQCKTAEGKYVLYYAFAQRAFLDYVPLKKLLYQRRDSKTLDWRNEQVCRVCRSFLQAMIQLDQSGYSYNHFDIERIIYQESTGNVIFRFSPYIRRQDQTGAFDTVNSADIAQEFAAPYIYKESYKGFLPKQADYYSIAAILFRLMLSRLPYEGRGLSNYGYVFDPVRDVDPLAHNNYFLHYHNFPHFIFDPEDESNRMAPMQENDLVRERWDCLPTEIKTMFQNALSGYSAETLEPEKLYSPAQWLESCNQYCWNTSEVGGE